MYAGRWDIFGTIQVITNKNKSVNVLVGDELVPKIEKRNNCRFSDTTYMSQRPNG